MPNFKFIKQFSTQVMSGGFNNQISTKTIPQGTVLSGKYVENKTNGTKEVNVTISYIPIQGQTDNVNVPLSYVVETTEPVSKNSWGGFEKIEPTPVLMTPPNNTSPQPKKYIFLEDAKVYRMPPNNGQAQTQQIVHPKEFKKDEIVDGIARKINGDTYIQIGIHGVLYNSPVANIKPILKELNPEQKIDPAVIFKEKPTTTEKPTFFNKKNITTGVFVLVGIGATLALLKWKKII